MHHQVDEHAARAPGRASTRSSRAASRGGARWRPAAARARRSRAAAQLDDLREVAEHVADHQHPPGALAAAPIASASSSVSAIGFSSSTCLPAASAAPPPGGAAASAGRRRPRRRPRAATTASQSVTISAPRSAGDRVPGRAGADDPHLRAVAEPRVDRRVRAGHEASAEQRDADHERPCGASASREARIAAVTSSSGGHGSPVNSISTAYGPS